MTPKHRGSGGHRGSRGGRPVGGLVGLIGIGVLVVASTVACSSSDDSTDVSSPSTPPVTESTDDAQTDDTQSTVAPTTVPSPTTTVAAELVTMIDVEPVAVAAPFADADVGDGQVTIRWIVPWQEGFLAVGTVHPRLPSQLPEEVAALFPPEVVDLFPDGLPSTVGEATAVLEEAGLYEVVSDIVSANPAAYDVFFPPPPVPPVPVFAWSEDGEAWMQLDGSFPDGMADAQLLAVGGDSLVLAGSHPADEPFAAAGTTMVSTTSDLSDWTTHVIEPQLPADLPDGVRPIAIPISLVANETGWVLEQGVSLDFQFEELLPPDVADRLITEDLVAFAEEEGVRIQPAQFDASGGEAMLLTWEDLGFDASLLPYVGRWDWGSPPTLSELWTATWTGSPVRVDTGQPTALADTGETLVSTRDGFLWLSDGLSYSPDGITWTAVSIPPLVGDDLWTAFDFNVPLPDGVAVFTTSATGETAAYRVDATGQEWQAIGVPGIPDHLAMASIPPESLWIAVASPQDVTLPPQWLVVTPDGDRWLIDELDDGRGDVRQSYLAALNGNVLLVGPHTGDWMRYDLTGS